MSDRLPGPQACGRARLVNMTERWSKVADLLYVLLAIVSFAVCLLVVRGVDVRIGR